jgi:hypothetical protein
MLAFGFVNYVANLNSILTLILFTGSAIYVQSVCNDIYAIWFGESGLQLLTTFLHLTSKNGNGLFKQKLTHPWLKINVK